MYEKEKELYKKMKEAIDQSTLLLDEKAIEIGKAINEAHRLIGERKDLIETYEKETGLRYDKTLSVDIEKLEAIKDEHIRIISGQPETKEELPLERKKDEHIPEKKALVKSAPDLGSTIWSFALLPMALTEKTLSPSTISVAVAYEAPSQSEDEINLVFHYEGSLTEEEVSTLAQKTLDNLPEIYTEAIIPEGKTIRLKGIRDEETGSLEEYLSFMAKENNKAQKDISQGANESPGEREVTPAAPKPAAIASR